MQQFIRERIYINDLYGRYILGNVDSEPVESSKSLREKSTQWSDQFLDESEAELLEYLDKHSEIGMFYIEFSYRQIGKDEKWFQAMCKELLYNKIKIKRELLLQRIRGTNDSPFDPEDLDIINGLQKDVLEERNLNKIFMIRLYERINPQIPYIIGVDCATGTNNDNTAISIVDPYKERAVGEAKSPIMDPLDVCTFLRLIIRDICPRGILAIERNSLGDAVIQILKRTEVSYNLYYDSDKFIVGDPDEKLDQRGFLVREAENRRSFGVFTSTKNREIMIQIMLRLVQEKKESFCTAYIINDLNNLIKKASGKIEARAGYHDDNIMSFLIAMYIRYHGKKLSNWGFVPGGTPMGEDLKPLEYEDIYEEMTPQMKEYFPAPPKEDPYQQQIKDAILRSQRERNNFSDTDGVVVTKDDKLDMDYENIMHGDMYTDDDDSFFKDINS